ncbi:EpsG family protein [Halovibrio variabilis]|uniref:EpsG family protein n=1 Tax=Halovibrio variabilis TaxID=31910 RepID=UPI0011BE0DDF|nr:EpsG family protein [Halovibrio variabilis]
MQFIFKKINIFLLFSFLLLVFVAAFRVFGYDSDYHHYFNVYNYGVHLQASTKELFFVFARFFLNYKLDLDFFFLLFVYAVLGVGLKFLAIKRLSVNAYYSVYIYVITFFLLHEYTQIRAGVASAIVFLSLFDVLKGRLLIFLMKISVAVLFHWSALLALPIYFFRNRSLLLFFVVLLASVFLSPFSAVFVNSVFDFLSAYSSSISYYYSKHSGHTEYFLVFNIYSLLVLSVCLLSYFAVLLKKIPSYINSVTTLLIAVCFYSAFLYFIFAGLHKPVVAFRSSEFFFVVIVFLIPHLSKLFASFVFIRLYLFFVPLVFFWHLVFRVNILPSLQFY